MISTLYLRSCIMGSTDRAEDGQRWQVMERSRSQGQWSAHWGTHIVCRAIVTSITALLQRPVSQRGVLILVGYSSWLVTNLTRLSVEFPIEN